MLTAEEKQRNRDQKKQRVAYYKGVEEQRKAAAVEQSKREALIAIKLTITDKELKLLNLALSSASPETVWQSALIKFGESLRSRHETIKP